jgi:hypothetical protein
MPPVRVKETAVGLRHLGYGYLRTLLGRKRDIYLKRYAEMGMPVVQATSADGNPSFCPRCGYVMMEMNLEHGWTLEVCSAWKYIKHFNTPEFNDWLTHLKESKLPSSRTDHILQK